MSNPKKKGTGVALWSVMTVLLVILLIASIVGTNIALSSAQAINIALKTPTHKVINQDGSVVYFENDFDSVENEHCFPIWCKMFRTIP